MANFEKLLEQLKRANLPKGKWAVFGSGPMGARGLKEPHDLDIIVTKDVFDEFKMKEEWEEQQGDKDSHLELKQGGIEICHSWFPGQWDIEALINDAETIGGVPYVSLEKVLEWKKMMARPKDLEDIKKIEEYLNK